MTDSFYAKLGLALILHVGCTDLVFAGYLRDGVFAGREDVKKLISFDRGFVDRGSWTGVSWTDGTGTLTKPPREQSKCR
jgi:hypothetical protein